MDYTNSQPGHASSGSHSQAFSCHLCGRQFKSSSTFAEHTKVFHTRGTIPARPREALFPCKECGKAFTSPSKRTIHQNTVHKGLRPHQCHVCEKSFGYKGDLTKHLLTHSGEKPHACYICGTRFARNYHVKRHIEMVHEKKKTNQKSKV